MINHKLIGMDMGCVEWLNHPHFNLSRNPTPNLQRQMIHHHELEERNKIQMKQASLTFKLDGTNYEGSVFVKVLVKRMILEWFYFLFVPDSLLSLQHNQSREISI
jgi:hypothetical protein